MEQKITTKAFQFCNKLTVMFHNKISKHEATTFSRIAQHLSEQVRGGLAELEIFDRALGWADEAMSIQAKNPKGFFVAKVKEETGFTGRGLLLKAGEG